MNRKEHWEEIYKTKQPNELSWFQSDPQPSLDWITKRFPKDAAIIDIGGGDSLLTDQLLERGYNNLTVLDVSENAIQKAKHRLGDKALNVKWIISDVIHFTPLHQYDGWHDRATFHFLTDPQEIHTYKRLLESTLKPNGKAMIGTFSEKGPQQSDGTFVANYSANDLQMLFKDGFEVSEPQNMDHLTPFNTIQNFNFVELKPRKD